jgi:hypothetical protein
MNMSKTNALKAASKTVTPINRRSGTDYVFYADHIVGGDTEGSYEVTASSYESARLKRSTYLAVNALGFMGKRNDGSVASVHAMADDSYANHTAPRMLDGALAE